MHSAGFYRRRRLGVEVVSVAPILLRNECLEALVLPHIGGGLAQLNWIVGQEPVPLLRPLNSKRLNPDPNELACYPMIPWCNRIGAGRFEYNNKHYQIAPNRADEPYPIHGDGWLSAWTVVTQSPTAVTLQFDKNDAGPFTYRGSLHYRLDAHTLVVTLSVENFGHETMPFGLGLHPWFIRTPKVTVQASAAGLWEANQDLLPSTQRYLTSSGALSPLHAAPGKTIDNSFFGWDGQAVIQWPEYNLGLQIETSPKLSHFVFYARLGQPFFCLEPVTHPINALNLPFGYLRDGIINLAKGESCSINVRFLAIPLDGKHSN